MTTTNQTPRKWLGLTAILAATLMDLLDATVLNIAAPAIHRSLGGSTAALQWFAAAYTLALASGLLIGGRLGDMYGRRRMLLGAAAAFTVTSLACAFAWSPASLIGARALQGLTAALMVPQTFGLIKELFPGKETAVRAGAICAWTTVTSGSRTVLASTTSLASRLRTIRGPMPSASRASSTSTPTVMLVPRLRRDRVLDDWVLMDTVLIARSPGLWSHVFREQGYTSVVRKIALRRWPSTGLQ